MREVASAMDPDAESQGSDLEAYRTPAGVSPFNKDTEILPCYHLRSRDKSMDTPILHIRLFEKLRTLKGSEA